MKAFTLLDFKKLDWTIPNLESTEFSIVPDINPNYCVIKHNNTSLLSFSKNTYWPDVNLFDLQLIKDLGLYTDSPNQSAEGVLCRVVDTLYYKANPYKAMSKSGKLFVKTFKNLNGRLTKSKYKRAPVTQELINIIVNKIHEGLVRDGIEINTSNIDYRNKMSEILLNNFGNNLICCYLTGKILIGADCTYERLSGVHRYVARNVNPTDYGYTYTSNGNYLLEGEYIYNSKVYKVADGHTNCPCCGKDVPSALFDKEENMCFICIDNIYKIHNYSTRVPSLLQFKAKRVTPKTIYLGCELEYETTNKDVARRKVGKLLQGHAIMKSDGSITSGFEIVTCPATLDIQLEEFKEFFDKRPEELRIASNVGMHVHVSRKPLNYLTQGKITEFMNRADNAAFIKYIAGRDSNNYSKQDPNRTVSYPFLRQEYSERYNTVNLNNKDTLEFRIFSTPMCYQDFAAKVQFCQALVDYCLPAQISAPLKQQTLWKTFVDWVTPQRKVYPELVATLKGFA